MEIEYKPSVKEAKKGEIKAEWIKKEKLTLMETKEDKKNKEKGPSQQSVQQNAIKVGLDIEEEDMSYLGFGKKSSGHSRADDNKERKGGRKQKPQFSADDFPTL